MNRTPLGKIASVALLVGLALPCAYAADVSVSALFNGKAVLVVDGGRARTVSVGETTPEGVKLVSANSEAAVIEYAGRRETLTPGQGTRVASSATSTAAGEVTLTADSRGHFVTTGAVNGISVQFLVDTGATSVAFSASEAKRLGVNYLNAPRGYTSTANGVVAVYKVKLDSVRVGDVVVNNVDAAVVDGAGLHIALLGMTFLNRMQMKRDGDTLTLMKRY